jgi:uncharacterized protein (TIGR00299 family) protein
MRIAYFDCFSGASGDMILGACLDAGVSVEALREELGGLGVPGFTLAAEKIRKQGFSATQAAVQVDPAAHKPHRHLKHIREIVEQARLPETVRHDALAIFTRLAEAEAQVHGTTIEKVHFHEVGAIDAIVDVVGSCLALAHLGVERIFCSPIPTGSGTVVCDHGVMPVPAPATAILLTGVPIAPTDETGELTTPTGAAILTTLAAEYGPCPAMTLRQVGVGSGRREGTTRPNIMRLLIGDAGDATSGDDEFDEVAIIEVNLDDASGEVIGYAIDRLMAAGALDAYATPIVMKKNRPAVQLTVLCGLDSESAMQEILLAETTTLGVRSHHARRRKLARTVETVQTPAGPIRIKIGTRSGEMVKASPEFEDCRAAAERTGRTLTAVMQEAMRIWQARSAGSQ